MSTNSTKRATRLGSGERRLQLLHFGQEFFAHHRFNSLTMSELADKAGVSKGLLYHYFGDRHGYYLATVRFTMENIVEVIGSFKQRGVDDLRAMFFGLTDYFAKTKDFYFMSIRSGDIEVKVEISKTHEVFVNKVLETKDLKINQLKLESPLGKVAMRGWVAFCESAIADWLEFGLITQDDLVDLMLYQMKCSLNGLDSGDLPTNLG